MAAKEHKDRVAAKEHKDRKVGSGRSALFLFVFFVPFGGSSGFRCINQEHGRRNTKTA
jgi:hypothetical protein